MRDILELTDQIGLDIQSAIALSNDVKKQGVGPHSLQVQVDILRLALQRIEGRRQMIETLALPDGPKYLTSKIVKNSVLG